jgi:hypothetical protein
MSKRITVTVDEKLERHLRAVAHFRRQAWHEFMVDLLSKGSEYGEASYTVKRFPRHSPAVTNEELAKALGW